MPSAARAFFLTLIHGNLYWPDLPQGQFGVFPSLFGGGGAVAACGFLRKALKMLERSALRSWSILILLLGRPAFGSLITNGSFESTSVSVSNATQISDNPNGPDSSNPSFVTVFGWARGGPNTWVQPVAGSSILEGPATGVNNGLGPSPDGGNYLAICGASSFRSSVSQTVVGLIPGQSYALTFYEGAGQQVGVPAATLMDHFDVSFGSQTQSGTTYTTSNFGFSGWHQETLTFTATSSSQALNFMAVGSPNLEPYMVLDAVSLTAVPEPSSALICFGCLAFGAVPLKCRAARRPPTACAQ